MVFTIIVLAINESRQCIITNDGRPIIALQKLFSPNFFLVLMVRIFVQIFEKTYRLFHDINRALNTFAINYYEPILMKLAEVILKLFLSYS